MFFFNKKLHFPPQPASGDSYTNFKHINDEKLYTDNEYALEFLKNSVNNYTADKENISYHSYWYGKINEKHVFSIKSLLCTQKNKKVYLWLDNKTIKENSNNKYISEIENYIEIKTYNPKFEIKNTCFEKFDYIFSQNKNLPARADAFRLLIPYKYLSENKYEGVIYFDLDVLFLRDFSNILNDSFCYQWEKQPYANTAVLFFDNENIIENTISSIDKYKTVLPWVVFNFSNLELKDMMVFPCTYFDPVWNITDKTKYDYPILYPDDFFKNYSGNITSYKEFFTGCYAYHWHNQWNVKPDSNSLFNKFHEEFNYILKNNK
ncbi:glycosyltransferase [uncultured Brachyspira sp.]|uniref:glycosyltransferase n=1 Tax=uncultured Brachyspira sp. TaxID=221953 RepID=UPI00260A7021|nr:glycosyltransferase [uncultured Brachyspira sp.]